MGMKLSADLERACLALAAPAPAKNPQRTRGQTSIPDHDEPGLCVTIPLRLNTIDNATGHWSKKAKEAKRQREAVALALLPYRQIADQLAEGCVVIVTRCGKGILDKHNLPSACKTVVDSVGVFLFGGRPGQHDNDERVEFVFSGLKCPEYGVILSIRATSKGVRE